MHGSAYANKAMQNADVIVALGARFDDRVTGKIDRFAPAAKKAETQGRGGIIHFEISPKNMNKVVRATEPVYGDVAENMARLLPHIKPSKRTGWFDQIAHWKKEYPFHYSPAGPGEIRPQAVIEELYEQMKHRSEDLVVTTGVGQHQMWAAQYIRWRHPRSMITSGGAGTMGYGVPSAIGAKVALGDKKVVVDIDGDASFAMTGMEMLTAAQYNIGVKILILNNHFQGMVKQWQDLFYEERYSGTPMVNPDFAKLGVAMGVHGIRLDKPEDLKRKMKEFLEYPGPVIMDAQVTKESHVFPMVPAGKPLDEMVYGPPKGANH
jgi:acetolactate synthase-1/2/3 large subunit